jgi:chemotaxis protein CheX
MSTHYDDVIEQIVQSVFSTMLNIDVARTYEPASTLHESPIAAVQIAGEWMGSVVLGLSPDVARSAAAAMLQIPETDAGDDDRRDVAAELVNMIGGNLKSLLPAPSYLSLPTIVSGREFGVQVHDAELLDDVVFVSSCGPLRVRLFIQLPVTAASAAESARS